MKKLQQLLCLLLCLVFCLALLPAAALAEDEDTGAIALAEDPEPAEEGVITIAPPEDETEAVYNGTCGDNLTWSYNTSSYVLAIEGTGDMYNWGYFGSVPWYNYCSRIGYIYLPDGLNNIGDFAFFSCSNITSVTIPSGVTSIGANAFYECTKLSEISIPDSLTSIGDSAFANCIKLNSVTIPANVTSIQQGAFDRCDSMMFFDVAEGNTAYCSIDGVLYNKAKTMLIRYPSAKNGEITIPETVTSLGNNSFETNSKLRSVYFEGSLPSGTNGVFSGITATAYYPGVDVTWSKTARQNFGGSITWNPYFVDPYASVFKDVKASKYYYVPVLWAYYHDPQVTGGTGDGTTFSPNDTCTRAQVMTFLWKAAGAPEPVTTENPFTDVPEGKYYYKPVLWAYQEGITSGTSDTTFGSNDGCTRAQVVTFLWRFAGSPDPKSNENPFEDVNTWNYYYKPVLWAVENGITAGMDATHFGPNNTCTRGQIVTFLYKYMEG